VTRPTEASVVPIRIAVDGRAGLTLWATPWEEDGEEWQAFLGTGSRVLAFGTAEELAEFLHSGTENDLSDHPQWSMLSTLPPDQLLPDDDYSYDLDSAYDLAATDPDPYTVSDLSDLIDIVQRMAECCDDGTLIGLVEDSPEFAELLSDEVSYSGTDGEERWTAVGEAIDRSWELVIGRLGRLVEWRGTKVLVESAVDADDDDEDDDDLEIVDLDRDDDADEDQDQDQDDDEGAPVGATGTPVVDDPARQGPDGEVYDVWDVSGILPVQITLPDGTGYTLRTYAGPEDEPTFLGGDLTVYLFRSGDGLVSFIREVSKHDLAEMVTWSDIRDAAELTLDVGAEEVYDLRRPTEQSLDIAIDLAQYCQLGAASEALGDGDEAPADWDAVVTEIASCMRWYD
jgi:hypothetical protein